jgi:co-chaperonin GroES (HSP10)
MVAAVRKPVEYDPRQEILNRLGDLSHVEIAGDDVLLAIYQRPDMTPGGIALAAQTLKEDVYQGKVGLVVKIGPTAKFDHVEDYAGPSMKLDIKEGDWVVVRPSDTWPLDINGDPKALAKGDFTACRLVKPRLIRLRVQNPNVIW